MSLEKWYHFAPEMSIYNDKLLTNGYTDDALLLLDPNSQDDWGDFLNSMSLTPGDKLLFKDRIKKFQEQKQSKFFRKNRNQVPPTKSAMVVNEKKIP